MAQTTFQTSDVRHIASLANIPIAPDEEQVFAEGFTATMQVVDQLTKVDVSGVDLTNRVTGPENVFREDVVDEGRMFSQDQALMNAPRTYNGYFVVDQILDQE